MTIDDLAEAIVYGFFNCDPLYHVDPHRVLAYLQGERPTDVWALDEIEEWAAEWLGAVSDD